MSLLRANSVQIGQSNTATNNFTLSVPSSPDGTIKLARGNSGATTSDILNIANDGTISFSKPPVGSIVKIAFGSSNSTTGNTNSAGAWVTCPSLSVSISPTFSTSLILVQIAATASGGDGNERVFRALRNGSVITYTPVGSFGGVTGHACAFSTAAYWGISTNQFNVMDNPNTTSAVTYTLQGYHQGGTGLNWNGTTNSGASDQVSGISSITLYEIAQ